MPTETKLRAAPGLQLYVLRRRKPILVDHLSFIREVKTRRVRLWKKDGYFLSTVFLGMPRNDTANPQWFETGLRRPDGKWEILGHADTYREALQKHSEAKAMVLARIQNK